MAELEELEQEELDTQLLEVTGPGTDSLPSVPTAEPVKRKSRASFSKRYFHGLFSDNFW